MREIRVRRRLPSFHTIGFRDTASPNRLAKPAGILGCEIWVKLGDPPKDPAECRFTALATASPHIAEYEVAEAGKTARSHLRWVQSNGAQGVWSETVSATVVG